MGVQEDRQGFGRALATARKSRHLSQAALAKLLGSSVQSAVSSWETGKTVPDRATVFKLEEVLGLVPGYLSGYLGYRPPPRATSREHMRTPECIENDPDLTPYERSLLLALYREIRAHPRPRPARSRRPRPASD